MSRVLYFIALALFVVSCGSNDSSAKEEVRNDTKLKYMDSLNVHITEGVMGSDSGAYSFSYDFLLFGKGNGDVGKKIDRVSYDLLADNTLEGLLDSAVYQQAANRLVNQYQEARMQSQYPVEWEMNARMVLALNKFNILSLQYDKQSRRGQRSTRRFVHANFRLDDGSLIQLEDFIADDKIKELERIAENTFRKQYDIQQNMAWERTPFVMFADGFKLNQNFLIRETGLLFVYNPFDAALAEDRHFEMIIPWKEIEHLISEGSVAQNFISN